MTLDVQAEERRPPFMDADMVQFVSPLAACMHFVASTRRRGGTRITAMTSPCPLLIVTRLGRGVLTVRDETVILNAGDAAVLGPFETYTYESQPEPQGNRFGYVAILGELMDPSFADLPYGDLPAEARRAWLPEDVALALVPGGARPVMRFARQLMAADKMDDVARAVDELAVTLAQPEFRPTRTIRRRPDGICGVVTDILLRIEGDMAARVDFGEIAEAHGLSQGKLISRFRGAMGVTPHAYLLNRRTLLATWMMDLDIDLAEAAAITGFADQAHMTRMVSRMTGTPPGRLRNSTYRLRRRDMAPPRFVVGEEKLR
jgi:AraC-like DNA-binding protein